MTMIIVDGRRDTSRVGSRTGHFSRKLALKPANLRCEEAAAVLTSAARCPPRTSRCGKGTARAEGSDPSCVGRRGHVRRADCQVVGREVTGRVQHDECRWTVPCRPTLVPPSFHRKINALAMAAAIPATSIYALTCTAEANDGREAVEKAREVKPDVTILDISMPSLNGLEAARQMLKNDSRSKILILTMHESDPLIREVLDVGERGYVLKTAASQDLVNAVNAVRSNKTFFTAKVAQMVLDGYLEVGRAIPRARKTG